MSDKTKNFDNIWAKIGKGLVAVIGLVGGIIAIYAFAVQKEEKLTAIGYCRF